MNRESFLETVRQHYLSQIHSVFLLCEHGKEVDFPKLEKLLRELRDAANCEGVPHSEFEDLIKSVLPEIWEQLNWKPQAA